MAENNTNTQQFGDADATTIFSMPATDATMPDLMKRTDRPNAPTLTIIKGPHTGTTFVLDTPEISIGRDPKNDVFLNDMTVSRRHAHMILGPGIPTIEDLGSLNGTWVDGAIVNRAVLADGSTIQVGTFRMVFHTQQPQGRIQTSE
jgi:pSer/pThr/pTyr-binding forkhead associated (FHA) protein